MKKYNIYGLLFPSPETAHRESEGLVRYCQAHGVKNLVAPPINVLGDGLKKTVIREIRIEDLINVDVIGLEQGKAGFQLLPEILRGLGGGLGGNDDLLPHVAQRAAQLFLAVGVGPGGIKLIHAVFIGPAQQAAGRFHGHALHRQRPKAVLIHDQACPAQANGIHADMVIPS